MTTVCSPHHLWLTTTTLALHHSYNGHTMVNLPGFTNYKGTLGSVRPPWDYKSLYLHTRTTLGTPRPFWPQYGYHLHIKITLGSPHPHMANDDITLAWLPWAFHSHSEFTTMNLASITESPLDSSLLLMGSLPPQSWTSCMDNTSWIWRCHVIIMG